MNFRLNTTSGRLLFLDIRLILTWRYQRALVTGGLRGLGLRVAKWLADTGRRGGEVPCVTRVTWCVDPASPGCLVDEFRRRPRLHTRCGECPKMSKPRSCRFLRNCSVLQWAWRPSPPLFSARAKSLVLLGRHQSTGRVLSVDRAMQKMFCDIIHLYAQAYRSLGLQSFPFIIHQAPFEVGLRPTSSESEAPMRSSWRACQENYP